MTSTAPLQPGQLRVQGVTKTYGDVRTLEDVSFCVEPGSITGFLGPNGAGKSTTLRIIMGLTRATSGEVLIDGSPPSAWPFPGRKVAAVLSNRTAHPRRTALDHLRWIAPLLDVDTTRCHEVLDQVGLEGVARTPVGQFSLGMRQRLAIATALLGDPQVLLLDEPMNGLDPEGISWLKVTLDGLRAQGRTILLASHLLKEMEDLIDEIVILAQGRVVASGTLADVVRRFERTWVLVRVDDRDAMADAVRGAGGEVLESDDPQRLRVAGLSISTVGMLARDRGLAVQELTEVRDLNSAFREATRGQTEILRTER